MQLICELFKNLFENTTRFEGVCYDKNANPSQIVKKPVQIIKQNQQNAHLDRDDILQIEKYLQTETTPTETSGYSKGAEYYIIVVICFYSLSIVFLLIFNSKFKCVINKNTFHCIDNDTENDLYELQKEETKTTIELLFQNSTKLFTSIAAPPQAQKTRNSIEMSRKKSTVLPVDNQSLLTSNEETVRQNPVKLVNIQEKNETPYLNENFKPEDDKKANICAIFESVV
jgi:hypothetical protein